MKRNTRIVEELKGHNEIVFANGKRVVLSGPIGEAEQIDEFLVVQYWDESAVREWENSPDLELRRQYRRHLERMCQAVWCFRADGELHWTMPPFFSFDLVSVKTGEPTWDIFVGFFYEPDLDCIRGVTSHGLGVRVKLDTGELLERTREFSER